MDEIRELLVYVSWKYIAIECKVSRQTIFAWKTGRKEPKLSHYLRFMKLLKEEREKWNATK